MNTKTTKLLLVGGDMVLKFNRTLTEKEFNKLVKTYNAVNWVLFYYDELTCEIAFQRATSELISLPKHDVE